MVSGTITTEGTPLQSVDMDGLIGTSITNISGVYSGYIEYNTT
jgi:hypothetical protein